MLRSRPPFHWYSPPPPSVLPQVCPVPPARRRRLPSIYLLPATQVCQCCHTLPDTVGYRFAPSLSTDYSPRVSKTRWILSANLFYCVGSKKANFSNSVRRGVKRAEAEDGRTGKLEKAPRTLPTDRLKIFLSIWSFRVKVERRKTFTVLMIPASDLTVAISIFPTPPPVILRSVPSFVFAFLGEDVLSYCYSPPSAPPSAPPPSMGGSV